MLVIGNYITTMAGSSTEHQIGADDGFHLGVILEEETQEEVKARQKRCYMGSVRFCDIRIHVFKNMADDETYLNGSSPTNLPLYFYSPIVALDTGGVHADWDRFVEPAKAVVHLPIDFWDQDVHKKVTRYLTESTGKEVNLFQVSALPFEEIMLCCNEKSDLFDELPETWQLWDGRFKTFYLECSSMEKAEQLVQYIKMHPENFASSFEMRLYVPTRVPRRKKKEGYLSFDVNFVSPFNRNMERLVVENRKVLENPEFDSAEIKEDLFQVLKTKRDFLPVDSYAPVTYDITKYDYFNYIDLDTGVFRAPINGNYQLKFRALTKNDYADHLFIQVNGEIRKPFPALERVAAGDGEEIVSFHEELELKRNDTISICKTPNGHFDEQSWGLGLTFECALLLGGKQNKA